MKILHVIPTLSPSAGGPTEVALELVRHLNSLGAEAEIITTDDDGDKRVEVPCGEVIDFKGVPVRFFPRVNPRLKEFIISPSAVRWLHANMKKYDILDIHYLFSFVPLVARSLARHKKIAYTVRTMGQLSPWALQQSKIKKQIFFYLQEQINLDKADALHSTSMAEEADIRKFGLKNRIINLPLGVAKPKPVAHARTLLCKKYGIQSNRFIILFLARLHYKKRPELAIEVADELRKEHQVHLLIAGAGDAEYERRLREICREKKMSEVVTFTGFVEGLEKEIILQGCDLFILPSYSENFGVAVAESLAAGTPVVVTPEVQISEYLTEYKAGLISTGDQDSFKKAIETFIMDAGMTEEYSINGLRLVEEKFNWALITRELLREYNLILERRGLPT